MTSVTLCRSRAGMGSRNGFAEYAESGQGRQLGDWMVLKLLVSNQVNIALGSSIAVSAQPPLKWSLVLSVADESTIIIRLNIE